MTASADLPQLLAEVVDCCGLAAAATFAQRFGGHELYVPLPASIGEAHPLAEALGLDGARRLAEQLGPGRRIVPFGPFAGGRRRRRREMLRLIDEGRTKAAVAEAFEVHERSVYRVRQERAARPPEPLPLFPDTP